MATRQDSSHKTVSQKLIKTSFQKLIQLCKKPTPANLVLIEKLLLEDPNLANQKTNQGQTPLLITVGAGAQFSNSSAGTKLLLRFSDAKIVDADGRSPLTIAAAFNQPEFISLLLPVSDVDSMDEEGMTALMMAVYTGHSQCVQLLLPHSNATLQDQDGLDALMHAVYGKYENSAMSLIPFSNLDAKSRYDETAYDMAMSYNQTEVAEAIRAAKISFHEKDVLSEQLTSPLALPSKIRI